MGLDMYLEAMLHLPPYSEELAPIRHAIGQAIGYTPPKQKPGDDATLMEITGVTVRVGYWWKPGPLHQWFVINAQKGHEDCGPIYLTPDLLAKLEEQFDQVADHPESVGDHFVSECDEPMSNVDIDYSSRIVMQAKRLQDRGWDIYYRASR